MPAEQTELFAEQLGRLADKIGARLDAIEEAQRHHKELETEKFTTLKESVTRFKNAHRRPRDPHPRGI